MGFNALISYILIFIILLTVLFLVGLANSKTNWNHLWLNSIDGWLRLFCRYYHRFDYQKILIPESGDAIIVSNHISGLDPFLLVTACDRPIRFLIAREEYDRFGLTWLFKAGGCIPIDRSGNVVRAMSAAIQALKNGEVLAIFPEGVIHVPEQDKKPLKRGVALLAETTNSPIYPVHIEGVKGHGHVIRGLLLRGNITMRAGDKISCEGDSHKDCLQKITKILHP